MDHPGRIWRRGWRTRGRLPHADFAGLTQAVTFRLADALPSGVLDRLRRQLRADDSVAEERRAALVRERVHQLLDAGHGSCVLADPALSNLVQEALRAEDGQGYHLHAFVVMPNHVHVLVEIAEVALAHVVGRWKGASARLVNQALGRSGSLWAREYHDRFIRDEDHFLTALAYIRDNPVRAGLVEEASAWPGLWLRPGLGRVGLGSPPPRVG